MYYLFINSEKEYEELSREIFKSLGIDSYFEGDSSNVMNGYYNSFSFFGVKFKLEENSYDYEDDYRYMISIAKDRLSKVSCDESIETMIKDVVIKVLQLNMENSLSIEINDELEVIQ